MESVSLYRFENDEIRISIDAYFEGNCLVIDGYDHGKSVQAYWGDSDYEYVVRIPQAGIDFLFRHLSIEPGNKLALLHALAARFNTNSCYSDIRKFMSENGITCEGFTWI